MQIAITGIGIVSALGVGKDVNREQLLAGESHVQPAQILPTIHHEYPIGEVALTNQQLQVILDQPLNESRSILLGAVALQEALQDSALTKTKDIPFVNGTTVGGMDVTEQYYADWRKGDYTHLDLIRQHEADHTTQTLASHFSLGKATTISTACSSALNAIIHGANLLRQGQCQQVIVGGTEAMTRFHLNGFASLGILSQQRCRPFQEDRDGINLGEGAAYLVMEDADTARQRGAKIYAYLNGYANCCDAYHPTASSPEGEGAFSVMKEALEMAGIQPSEINLINAHGTATPNNDASEMVAIQRLFGEHIPHIESTKPLTGHTTSASGSIEAVFTIFRMEEDRNSVYHALSNAFGFGGNDSTILLSQTGIDLPALHPSPHWHICTFTDLHSDYQLPAMQARRMSAAMRQLVLTARQVLSDAGIESPDAIVAETRWGGLIPTVALLEQLAEQGEHDFSPAQFMSSTHNHAATTLARLLGCKGYNTTLVTSEENTHAAEEEARMLVQTTKARNVLICQLDEEEQHWQPLLKQARIPSNARINVQLLCTD